MLRLLANFFNLVLYCLTSNEMVRNHTLGPSK